jgi:alkyl sulfatase BDS1-like metallo-beta-lactamase superfamily hydrolase
VPSPPYALKRVTPGTRTERGAAMNRQHVEPLGRQPSAAPFEVRAAVETVLPFNDEPDFDEARPGFTAPTQSSHAR